MSRLQLNEEYRPLEAAARSQDSPDDGRRDVVGQIARQHRRLSLGQGPKIHVENVVLDQLKAGFRGKLLAEPARQIGVQFHGSHPRARRQQPPRQRALAGTYFDDKLILIKRERGDDTIENLLIVEKVLA